ncbi:MAG: ABC transporter ATP-binding protein, partial [Planctomycetes bacterium]|nr:ABC transporter ATP-binding protein [Planctomycetota bacterium]
MSPAAENKDRRERVDLGNLWRFMAFSLYWPWLAGGVVAGLARLALSLFMPWYVKYVIDQVGKPFMDGRIGPAEVWERMASVTLLLAGVMAVHGAATLGRFYFPHRAAASATRDVRFKLFRHLQRLSLGFHTQRPTGGIVARVIADVEAAQQAFDMIMVQLSQSLLRGSVILAILFSLDWQWALVSLAASPIFVVTTRLLRRPMRRATRRQRETVERISSLVQERFSMIREVQSFTAEPYEAQQVLDEANELRRHTLRRRLLGGLLQSASEITRFCTLAIVLAFGIYRITTGRGGVTIGSLPMFYMYTSQILQPMNFLAALYTRLQQAAAAADRVYDFFDTPPSIRDAPDARPLRLDGPPGVRFENVSFAYPAGEPAVVLKNIDFEIPPGCKVVLVGPSGGGKSTLMSLLPRFYDVTAGRVLINGQ